MVEARFSVRLTPSAFVERLDGWGLDASGRPVLKARVRARPVEGEANAALLALMARALGVPKSAVSLARGGQSRVKAITVAGLDLEAVRARLTDL